jgi:hypothetical protein
LEYISTDETAGDQISRFDPENFSSRIRDRVRVDDVRFGLRQELDSASDILFVATHQDRKSITDIFEGFSLNLQNKTDKFELQYARQQPGLSVAVGGTYLRADTDRGHLRRRRIVESGALQCLCILHGRVQPTLRSFNWERRTTICAPAIPAIASSFNPKVGLLWSPSDALTVRAAAYRVMKRRLVSEQGLEPTQVVGFNQYFDDENGDDRARRSGRGGCTALASGSHRWRGRRARSPRAADQRRNDRVPQAARAHRVRPTCTAS